MENCFSESPGERIGNAQASSKKLDVGSCDKKPENVNGGEEETTQLIYTTKIVKGCLIQLSSEHYSKLYYNLIVFK